MEELSDPTPAQLIDLRVENPDEEPCLAANVSLVAQVAEEDLGDTQNVLFHVKDLEFSRTYALRASCAQEAISILSPLSKLKRMTYLLKNK